jgi:hypothetical protein
VVDQVDQGCPDECTDQLREDVGTTFAQGKLRRTASAKVTAGLMWAPLIPPAT